MASVVSKFISDDNNYGALTLDDGSDTIRVKAFGPDVIKLKNVKVGSIIRFIGKLKEYNDEIYLAPEVAREIDDPNWILVHHLELGKPEIAEVKEEPPEAKPAAEQTAEQPEVKTEKVASGDADEQPEPKVEKVASSEEAASESNEELDNPSQKILDLIKEKDSGEGSDMKQIISDSGLDGEEAKNIIVGLLKSGDVFEPKKGVLKVLE